MSVDPSKAILEWRRAQRERSQFLVRPIAWSEIQDWHFDRGHLAHSSTGFFSVTGLQYELPGRDSWVAQPFILQPEIGILGFLRYRDTRGVHLLVQAKTEPGNCAGTQLAPSFQCTKSNYELRHGGEIAPFSEYFLQTPSRPPLTDVLQSEQGTRFIDKYNRNMVVSVARDAVELASPARSAWRWLPVALISQLIAQDFLFNTDARSVLSTTDWAGLCEDGEPFGRWRGKSGFGEALWRSYHAEIDVPAQSAFRRWLEDQQRLLPVKTKLVGVNEMRGWEFCEEGVLPCAIGQGPSVRFYAVQAKDREIPHWTQPLLTSSTPGLVLLVARRHDGVLKFGARLSREPGFANAAQLSATCQVLPGESQSVDIVSELCARCAASDEGEARVVFDSRMSEEGGRFYQDVNRYVILMLPDGIEVPDEANFCWLSLAEISVLKRESGVFTNEFRSILSLLLAYL